jgi:hypothetical protein
LIGFHHGALHGNVISRFERTMKDHVLPVMYTCSDLNHRLLQQLVMLSQEGGRRERKGGGGIILEGDGLINDIR